VATGYVALPSPARLGGAAVGRDGVGPASLSDDGRWDLEGKLAESGYPVAWVGMPSSHLSGPSVVGVSGWPARLPGNSHRVVGLAARFMFWRSPARRTRSSAAGVVGLAVRGSVCLGPALRHVAGAMRLTSKRGA